MLFSRFLGKEKARRVTDLSFGGLFPPVVVIGWMTGVSHLVSKTLLRILDLPLVCCKGSLAGIWHFLVDEKKRGKPMLLSPALLSGG